MSGRTNEFVRTQEYKRLALQTKAIQAEIAKAREELVNAQEEAKQAEEQVEELQDKVEGFEVLAKALKCQTRVLTVVEALGEFSGEPAFKGETGTHPEQCLKQVKAVRIAQNEDNENLYDFFFEPAEPLVIIDKATGEEVITVKELAARGHELTKADPEVAYGDLVQMKFIERDDFKTESLWIKQFPEKPTLGDVVSDEELLFQVQNADGKLELAFMANEALVLQAIPEAVDSV